jgi:hypothetical protein
MFGTIGVVGLQVLTNYFRDRYVSLRVPARLGEFAGEGGLENEQSRGQG